MMTNDRSIIRSIIRSVSHYVPETVVTNSDLTDLMETSDEWIVERTGIRERRFVKPGQSTADLGEIAAKGALAKAGWGPSEVDLIVVSTLSPDFYFPGVGVMLQERLGCRTIPAIDLRAQCSGLVYGLSCVDAFIKSGQAKKVLLVCSEVQSPVLDLTTRGRDMAVLFGDGAGALTLEAGEGSCLADRGIIDSHLGSDGSGADLLCLKIPGTANPGFMRSEDIEAARVHPQMEGRIVFKNAVARLTETAKVILERNNLSVEEISLVIPHQANFRINEMVREMLRLPPEKVFNNIQSYGNTTAATIPICMSEAVDAGVLKAGDLVLTLAFGAGFTWGGNLLRW